MQKRLHEFLVFYSLKIFLISGIIREFCPLNALGGFGIVGKLMLNKF